MNNQSFYFAAGRKWVTLQNGQEKLFSSFNDANSWSIQQKSPISKTEDFSAPSLPENYNPSKEQVIKSHILTGGSKNDFTENYLNS